MLNPRSLIFALYTHWDAMESLVPLGREMPLFEPEQVLSVLARAHPELAALAREDKLRALVSSGLLSQAPRGTGLEIHPLILDFVRGLTREHELGLSEVLRARVDGITAATESLAVGLADADYDKLRRGFSQLSDLFRHIRQQLEHDHHAILELAERAKSADASLPIARRYSEVLAAYDEYIEPMAAMMDPGAAGTFARQLEHAERVLDHTFEQLNLRGALYTLRLGVRHVAYQAKDLRRMGRELLNHCTQTLLPLREEVRQHNVLSAAVSELLGRVRKRGLKRTLRDAELPLWRRDAPRRVNVSDEISTIMAEARHYQPALVAFPEESAQALEDVFDRVDEATLHRDLNAALPVDDLLVWLRDYQSTWRDDTVLRLFHELLAHAGADMHIGEAETHTDLRTVRVRYFAHGLASCADKLTP